MVRLCRPTTSTLKDKDMHIQKIIGMLLIAFSLPALAQANRQVTSKNDLIGCWSKVDFSDQAKAKINEIEYGEDRYQLFCFEPDGALHISGSSAPIKEKTSAVHAAQLTLPKVISYQIAKPGVVVIVHSEANQTSGWISSFTQRDMEFDGKFFPKDTLTMGFIDVEKQKIVYWRYLIKAPEDK